MYHRLAGWRGAKRAIAAAVHRMLTSTSYVLLRCEPHHDLGAECSDDRKTKLVERMTRRIDHPGYRVGHA